MEIRKLSEYLDSLIRNASNVDDLIVEIPGISDVSFLEIRNMSDPFCLSGVILEEASIKEIFEQIVKHAFIEAGTNYMNFPSEVFESLVYFSYKEKNYEILLDKCKKLKDDYEQNKGYIAEVDRGGKIDLNKLSEYVAEDCILIFENKEEARKWFNVYDYQNIETIDEFVDFSSEWGFEYQNRWYHLSYEDCLDIWVEKRKCDLNLDAAINNTKDKIVEGNSNSSKERNFLE